MTPDPFANEHAIYDAEFSRLYRLFHTDPVNWPELSGSIDRALRDPALPRGYRGHYEAMRTLDPDQQPADARNHLQNAKVMAEEMRLGYQAQSKDEAWIEDSHAAVLEKLIAVIEASGVGDEYVASYFGT